MSDTAADTPLVSPCDDRSMFFQYGPHSPKHASLSATFGNSSAKVRTPLPLFLRRLTVCSLVVHHSHRHSLCALGEQHWRAASVVTLQKVCLAHPFLVVSRCSYPCFAAVVFAWCFCLDRVAQAKGERVREARDYSLVRRSTQVRAVADALGYVPVDFGSLVRQAKRDSKSDWGKVRATTANTLRVR